MFRNGRPVQNTPPSAAEKYRHRVFGTSFSPSLFTSPVNSPPRPPPLCGLSYSQNNRSTSPPSKTVFSPGRFLNTPHREEPSVLRSSYSGFGVSFRDYDDSIDSGSEDAFGIAPYQVDPEENISPRIDPSDDSNYGFPNSHLRFEYDEHKHENHDHSPTKSEFPDIPNDTLHDSTRQSLGADYIDATMLSCMGTDYVDESSDSDSGWGSDDDESDEEIQPGVHMYDSLRKAQASDALDDLYESKLQSRIQRRQAAFLEDFSELEIEDSKENAPEPSVVTIKTTLSNRFNQDRRVATLNMSKYFKKLKQNSRDNESMIVKRLKNNQAIRDKNTHDDEARKRAAARKKHEEQCLTTTKRLLSQLANVLDQGLKKNQSRKNAKKFLQDSWNNVKTQNVIKEQEFQFCRKILREKEDPIERKASQLEREWEKGPMPPTKQELIDQALRMKMQQHATLIDERMKTLEKVEKGKERFVAQSDRQNITKLKVRIGSNTGSIARTRDNLEKKKKELLKILTEAKSAPTEAYHFCVYTVIEKLIFKVTALVGKETQWAFAFGEVLFAVSMIDPELMMKTICGMFHRECHYTIPNPPQEEKEDAHHFKRNPVTRELETFADYEIRMSSLVRTYAAFLTAKQFDGSPHGMEECWSWLARMSNVRPAGSAPSMMHDFLMIAGLDMLKTYKAQFGKLMNELETSYLPKIKDERTRILFTAFIRDARNDGFPTPEKVSQIQISKKREVVNQDDYR